MNVEYSDRALADLLSIATYYASLDNPGLSDRVVARIGQVVAQIARLPRSGKRVSNRPGARVISVRNYPYLIFYRIKEPATIRIVHIRHMSRKPW
jgi:plasmid stabilization system protein ParE